MAKEKTGWDDPANEVQSNWMKFNVSATEDPEGADKIHGTLVRHFRQKSQMADREGEMQSVYDIIADEVTTFHKLDDEKKVVPEAIVINVGDVYSIGGTAVIDRQMQNIKLGQIIGLKFIELKKATVKGHSPAKIIKVYAPKNAEGTGPLMDEAWVAQNAKDEFGN